MNIQQLIRMANQIGTFFESTPDRDQAIREVAAHLQRFWDPRMRRALLGHLEEQGGEGLQEIVRQALSRHRSELLPVVRQA